MTDDATMEEKQNFLRETILEKGYDVNQFIEFLTEKKGEGGADVAVWSMSELQIVVREFIQLNRGEVEEPQIEPEIQNPEPNQQYQPEPQPNPPQQYEPKPEP